VEERLTIIAAVKARDARESMETMRHLESARQNLVVPS
jgi:hypothetical protein